MIIPRCQGLQLLLSRLKKAESDQQRAATLTPVHEALSDRQTRLTSIAVNARVLLGGGVLDKLTLPNPADLTAALQTVRTNLAADPFAVTKGRDYKALLRYLDALLDELRDQAVRAWGAWIDQQTARIDDAELTRYEVLPGFKVVTAEIRELRSQIAAFSKELPATPEELAADKQALDKLRELIAKLPWTDDAEVRKFLDAANSPTGASIDLLTPKVTTWLKEQPGLYQRYRVVVR